MNQELRGSLRKGDMLLLVEGQLTRLQGYFTNPDSLDELLTTLSRRTN